MISALWKKNYLNILLWCTMSRSIFCGLSSPAFSKILHKSSMSFTVLDLKDCQEGSPLFEGLLSLPQVWYIFKHRNLVRTCSPTISMQEGPHVIYKRMIIIISNLHSLACGNIYANLHSFCLYHFRVMHSLFFPRQSISGYSDGLIPISSWCSHWLGNTGAVVQDLSGGTTTQYPNPYCKEQFRLRVPNKMNKHKNKWAFCPMWACISITHLTGGI